MCPISDVDNSHIARIFIGGLSTRTSTGDLESALASLGIVKAVEFIRSNNRSFAFIDFLPKSEKALPKLLSMYNGCKWKGGKLKVEKAKEHYISRLKREWDEDARALSNESIDLSAGKISGDIQNPVILHPDMQNLQIFFPKLRKVKSLPIKGTGKHKYSFQHIQVPPMPSYFCDCEEHFSSSLAFNQPNLFSVGSVILDKETNIMKFVMNKLLERDVDLKPEMEKDIISEPPINDLSCEATEETVGTSDTENLVTNIGLQRGDMPEQMLIKEKILKPSISKPCYDGIRKKKRNLCTLNTGFPGYVGPPDISSHKDSEELRPQYGESFGYYPPIEVQINENANETVAKNSNTWVQKCSWKELIGEAGGGSFSISHVLSVVGAATESKGVTAVEGSEHSNSKWTSMASVAEEPAPVQELRKGREDQRPERILPMKGIPLVQELRKGRGDQRPEGSIPMKMIPYDSSNMLGENNDNACTFVRSADSEKEWARTRATLSGFLKKRTHDNNGESRTRGWKKAKIGMHGTR